MTNGFGAMLDYKDRVNLEDRWAIAAYIRALQLSQHAKLDLLWPEERQKVIGGVANPAAASTTPPTGATEKAK